MHKSTHHFDLINWWVASTPKTVTAIGKRRFYTPADGGELGLAEHGERCHGCPVFDKCDYRLDIENDPALQQLYLDAEDDDGYYRDRCVFADDITIEDTMQVQVQYANDVSLNYTLCAYSPVGRPRDHLPRDQGRADAQAHRGARRVRRRARQGRRKRPRRRRCISTAAGPADCDVWAARARTAGPTR